MPSAASTSSVAASVDGATAAASASEGAAAAPANAAASPRLLNTTVCVPIAYGSIAVYLGNSADDYATHEWTLYVRGPNDEDLSAAVAKVVFSLHPSFPQPVRELTAPPFEVTEKGWGEFEASIRIVWRDPEEKATVVSCFLVSNLMCATNLNCTCIMSESRKAMIRLQLSSVLEPHTCHYLCCPPHSFR